MAKAATEIVRNWDQRLQSTALNSLDAAQKGTNEAFVALLGLTLAPAKENDQRNLRDHILQFVNEWNSHLRFEIKGFAYEF